MNRLLLGLVFSALIAGPAFAALKVGDTAPDFRAQASLAGKTFTFHLKRALKKGPVVVYFYPSAYTHGCDTEAHTFAVDHEKFARAGATIIGVSLDSIARLNDFSADPSYCAGKFPTASDADGSISRAYQVHVFHLPPGKKLKDVRGVVIDHGFAERITFIITPNDKIAATIGGVAPEKNVMQALAAVKRLAARRS